MRIAISDESKKDREMLKMLLENYEAKNKQKFEVSEYDSGLELCRDNKMLQECHIIFWDISMDREEELHAAIQLRKRFPELPIVLVSANVSCAPDGYKVKASRFLLKSSLPETIGECMNTLLKKRLREDLVLQFSFVEGSTALRPEEIIYIETNRHKNIFHTHKGIFSIYKKLNEIEEELSGLDFVRIHQSFLVNMRYVDKISSYIMRLTTGIELSVPKSRYRGVKQQYMLYKDTQ
ncbi:MAG: response regulator [Lachnospiraceae bacterium]|nr:response regulator [Lachnospiraceae bacterium]